MAHFAKALSIFLGIAPAALCQELDLSAAPAPVPSYDERIVFKDAGRIVSELDVAAYQNDEGLNQNEDFNRGPSGDKRESWVVRLGRLDDMFVLSAFWKENDRVCSKHLYVRLRDGENIFISQLERTGYADHDVWRIRFGRKDDLVAWYAFRWVDRQFVFDPREPRFEPRELNTTISPGQFAEHDVIDGGCA